VLSLPLLIVTEKEKPTNIPYQDCKTYLELGEGGGSGSLVDGIPTKPPKQ